MKDDVGSVSGDGIPIGERIYEEEHVQLIRQIKSKNDYYSILGVEKSCSVEDIRKAYRKLSLKVHPDKNKAPGSEEAFKKVSKAFKCLSDDDSRRQYDQTGLVEEFEYNQQAFFGQNDVFRNAHIYRTRTNGPGGHQREDLGGIGPNLMLLLQLVPFLIIILLAYLPVSEPEYSLQKNYSYEFKKTTEKHGVEFFVKSTEFDENYPLGSSARNDIENNVIKDFEHMLGRYCHMEMQRRQWNRHFPTPHCDRLETFMA
ncbi:Chaperone protein dnaJ 49 [Forsythia ovata]|uniref:Chaperone protein dnaJ 49 n=1 Tax=Forsythia ovata TaxID=205694 RepID=A0ABD1PJH2_9LAMI